MEGYIRLEEEKVLRHGKVFKWETATISFDKFDDEDYTVIFDKNLFSYKLISVNDLKTDLKKDNGKVNMPLFPSPEPTVSCFDDLDFFKDFKNEFPAIVYNDALTSKSDFTTEPTLYPQHIDEFDLNDETSLFEFDEEELNVLYFNDLFPFNVIYPNELKSDTDNDNDKIDIDHSSRDLSVKPLPNTDVVYVLTTLMPELLEDDIVEAIRRRAKWENDDCICKEYILNGMSDPLFDIYQNVEYAKGLWDSLESKYMAKDASSKKFLGLKMDESIYVSSVIDKLPPFWKDFKHSLKYGKDDLSLVQLGSYLCIEESLRAHESDKGKGKEVARPSVNMLEEDGKNKKTNKTKERNVVLVPTRNLNWNVEVWAVVRLPDPKRKTLDEKGINCIFVRYAEHSKTYRFYVIKPNDYVSINTIIESRDAIFDENHFYSIHRLKDIIPNLDESQRDDHSNDVPIEGSRDQIGSQYSYCYSIEEDPRTYNEAMQSRDVAFWKEAIDDEIGLIYFAIEFEENTISNEYAVKLCLEHEVKKGNKVVKKELIVALRGEIYLVKFIINPEEDDVEPGVIFGRSFLRMTKAITYFGDRTIIIYPDIDPFLEETEGEDKSNDDWDRLIDFNIDDVPLLGEEGLLSFVCKIGKSNRNKKQAMENLNFFYQDVGTSSSAGGREDMKKVDRGITMINHTQAEAIGILSNILCQVGVTTLIAKFLILNILFNRDSPIVVGRGFLRMIGGIVNTLERLFSTFDGFCHQTFRAARSDNMRNAKSDSDDEEDYQIKRNKFEAPIYGLKPASYLNCNDPNERSLALQTITNPFCKISVWKKAVSFLGSILVLLKQVNWKLDYKGSYTKEKEATEQWRT
nr:hypothetical protein [Tanacetum cinerariifolium]